MGCQGNDAMMPGGEERLVADDQRIDMAFDRSGKGRLKIGVS
jgi:hypothetical protein